MANVFLTQSDLTTQYNNNILALNPNVNPEVIATDWWIKANIQGGTLAGIYQDAYNLRQAIFIQNASGAILDYYLATFNLTPRLASSPATGYATVPTEPGATATLLAGTQLTLGSNIYVIQSTVTVTADNYDSIFIPIESQAVGNGTALYSGTEIVFSTPIADFPTYLLISSMNDGSNAESDADVRYRILSARRAPKTGGNLTDYKNWCLSQPNITNIYTQDANLLGLNQLDLYLMSGTDNVDDILDNVPPASYDRTATSADILTCTNYVLTVKPLFDQLYFNTVYTYIPNSSDNFNVTEVTLIEGVDLTTVLPGFTINVENLIKRELRRSIISAPLAGTFISTSSYLILSSIESSIYNGLNSVNGVYAQVLVSFKLDFNSSTDDISVPITVDMSTGAYPAVYDVNYTHIFVTLA